MSLFKVSYVINQYAEVIIEAYTEEEARETVQEEMEIGDLEKEGTVSTEQVVVNSVNYVGKGRL